VVAVAHATVSSAAAAPTVAAWTAPAALAVAAATAAAGTAAVTCAHIKDKDDDDEKCTAALTRMQSGTANAWCDEIKKHGLNV